MESTVEAFLGPGFDACYSQARMHVAQKFSRSLPDM